MLNRIKKISLILLFSVVSSVSAAELNEVDINKMMDGMDQAVASLDANSIAQVLSDDVSITLNVEMQGQKQTIEMNKQEYVATIQQAQALYKNYKYARSNVQIKINAGKATVTADVKESMTVQGMEMNTTTKETATMELKNGQILITKLVGYSSL
ncbi:nuclear transport factor 2 family protein [Pelagibaculum spongiae]|uniref:SnoaL-like domain-containing protein n=1 Tax=Pelagibaculum spongiae TaxID=2080658 RepID=A0A2V1GYK3_9GAMM|nr:nuclear transport factor 2 family protein [Pelagibaculum spongiae]PVZ72144.1 hypothetical protein DC094_03780 [Pelagibaculum spongiae]